VAEAAAEDSAEAGSAEADSDHRQPKRLSHAIALYHPGHALAHALGGRDRRLVAGSSVDTGAN